MRTTMLALRAWPARRWLVVAGAALVTVLVIGLPTDVVPNPVFGRSIEVTAWSYPALVVTALLGGLLALGTSGAMQWFAPVQPYLAAAGVVLLAWALSVRLRGEVACPVEQVSIDTGAPSAHP